MNAEAESEDRLPAGWGFPGNARKAHWFDASQIVSVCGRWMHSGRRSEGKPGGPDDCAACVKKLRART